MSSLTLSFLNKYRDIGLLIMRVGLGVMFIGHGWPKLAGGAEKWEKVGRAMEAFGIDFGHTLWGFAAAVAECGGGVLLVLGLFTRIASLFLIVTMFVAASRHILVQGDPFTKWSHAVEDGIAFCGLFVLGPGKYSLDYLLFKKT